MAKEPLFKVIISRFRSSKKLRIAFFVVLGLLLLMFMTRNCSGSRIEHTHVYKIARTKIYPPIDLAGKEANLQAFLNDLLLGIAHEEKFKFSLVTLNYGDLFQSLEDGSYDAILTTVSINKLIKDLYSISDPIYVGGPVLVVMSDSNVTQSEELKTLSIGINKSSPHIFQINQKYGIRVIPYENTIAAIEEMEKGNISGVIMDAPLAYAFTQGIYKDRIKVVSRPLTDEAIRLIALNFPLGKNLVESFDVGLDKFLKDGTYQNLIQKWELVSP